MATKSIVLELSKGDKLNRNNYDIWHCKISYVLKEQDVMDILTTVIPKLESRNWREHEVYASQKKIALFTSPCLVTG